MDKIAKPFLTAEWRRLLLLQYDIDASLLEPHLPPGCVADTLDGRAFVSFVAFDFLNTRVMGVRWPGYVNFPEINLRAYVRHGERRGVVFIREFVPQRLVAFLANTIYNEEYRAVPMSSRCTESGGGVEVTHEIKLGGRFRRIKFSGHAPLVLPSEESTEHFFKEHEWGFGRSRRGTLITYRVQHPRWRVYGNPTYELDYDFAVAYGDAWAGLNGRTPHSVVLAEGSAVEVFPKG